MKFTEEQAVEALRAELTNKGRKTLHMSERTLASLTEKLVKKLATEETGLPDFVTDAIEILDVTEGDARKKNSDFAKYKESHPDTGPKTEDPEPPKPTENHEIQKLMERIAALEADKQASEKKASIAQKHSDIAAKLKEKGVKDEEWMNKLLSKVNLDRDLDIDAEVEDLLPLYNAAKANNGSPVPPANPQNPPVNQQYTTRIREAAEIAKQRRKFTES